ncbi:tagaturonate epimerase family protein [Luteolibacter marinus]|uniref:tagaturonate epimerase family protein n=1 Tax=Luteolibacter marinus TaxID=2776705 RepID=UPI001867F9B4|nr:tagaturonate epimerase family protein [Luteolibacter marinus]
MSAINDFLVSNCLLIANNPCVSPDFCLDWPALAADLKSGEGITAYPLSGFSTAAGEWQLVENSCGDHAWILAGEGSPLSGESLDLGDGRRASPATWAHLLELKNLILEHDPEATIFPSTSQRLGESTIGVGARFTTLHWPGVDWAMAQLGTGVTANQNSIPRELVYDVDVMLAGRLDRVPFPFIGTDVPEGHQGQSVEGMSHGCVLAKLKSGFHRRKIAWSFNADHQPIGGSFDVREDQLVQGCLLASYITFDLSPELTVTKVPEGAAAQADYVANEIDAALVATVKGRVSDAGLTLDEAAFNELLCRVWPSMKKMKVRDGKYRAIREKHFTTESGRAFLRELSIDELPGLTTPETTAIMLALCDAMDMPVQFVAPAFGFQKNMPYPDNVALRAMIERQWKVCEVFGVSIGFHSGSGKSAENYRVMGEVTGCKLEIKTSGRYTYEMGRALFASADPGDQALWSDWYGFTLELAAAGAFAESETERSMARTFISESFKNAGAAEQADLFGSPETCRACLQSLDPTPESMFWFEYNFLFVLAAEGKAEKGALGDHSAAGYRQRERFYSISKEGRLRFASNVARYIIFLCESTGLVNAERCAATLAKLDAYRDYDAFLADIAG